MSSIYVGNDYPALDIQDRSSTLTLATTPASFKPATIAVQQGITYDPSTGIITLPESRCYQTFLVANTSATGAEAIYAYVQVNTGSGFANSVYSGRQLSYGSNTAGQQSTTSVNFFAAGTQLLFYIWGSSNNTTVSTVALPNTSPTVYAPALRLMIGV